VQKRNLKLVAELKKKEKGKKPGKFFNYCSDEINTFKREAYNGKNHT
jgi:hypothetical protein